MERKWSFRGVGLNIVTERERGNMHVLYSMVPITCLFFIYMCTHTDLWVYTTMAAKATFKFDAIFYPLQKTWMCEKHTQHTLQSLNFNDGLHYKFSPKKNKWLKSLQLPNSPNCCLLANKTHIQYKSLPKHLIRSNTDFPLEEMWIMPQPSVWKVSVHQSSKGWRAEMG